MTKNDAAHVPGVEPEHIHSHDDLHPILRFVGKNWKPIAGGVAAALIIVGGLAVYESSKKASIATVQAEVGTVLSTKEGADRLAGLEKILADGPGAAKDGVLLEIAKTALELKDFAKAADAWKELAASAPKDMRAVALLGEASALSQAGDNANALDILEKIQGESPKTFEMLVIRQTAVTAEAAGNLEKAIQGYERLLAEGNLPNKTYLEAKIEELKAKAATAKEAQS
jgi:tetratricopeptide (TPR) repeat protein